MKKYLIMYEGGTEFWTHTGILDEDLLQNSEDGVVTIFNLEDLTFHVKGPVWQEIPEK